MHNFINNYINNFNSVLKLIKFDELEKMISIISNTKTKKGRIFFLGVGGSAGNCSHAVNDFRKLCGIECYSPMDNISEMSARTNDEGWDSIFKNWLIISSLNQNDLLFILSVGGGNKEKNVSVNLIEAIDLAIKKNVNIVSILGKSDGYAAKNSNAFISIEDHLIEKGLLTPISESMQTVIWHLLVSHPKLKINETKW